MIWIAAYMALFLSLVALGQRIRQGVTQNNGKVHEQ
ncbi:hypothetical protein CLV98_12034 [Dyadobacter jejuensis]|uniref:Uncharacterized protein n=1 Tax=Dyadobacter jejuensis TaxID=1082580 RepID=A0A316A9P2_9BACT|nr:hypothetical protein CLV98_12034 [Dyadobacter jejuensis]